jgi:vacuolar-type H+-ATPase subunit F/Vma7
LRLYCIADEDTVRGFRLAGVAGQAVRGPEEAAAGFTAAVERNDCDLLILTENVVAYLGPSLDALRAERSRPVVVEIPGPGGHLPGHGHDRLSRLVQGVVGTTLGEER